MGKKNRKGPSAKAKKAMYEKERGLAMRIYTAASQGDDDKIALTKNPLGYKDSNGRTPLHFAAHHGHVSTCKLLIQMSEKDAVNICDSEGASALLLAAAKGHTDVVRVLKDMGAKMDAAKLNGVNALHLAASGGYVSTVEWLLETLPATLANASSEMGTPMHFAAGYGHAEVCRALLDAQIDLHALNEDGITALVAATASNQVEIVEMMVNYEKTREGGDLLGLLMKRSKTGFMCLGVAAAGGSIEILKRIVAVVPSEMLSEIASAQNADADGQCPAEVAATAGHASAVDLLLPLTESDRVRKADGSRMNTTELLDKCMKVARDKEANRLSEMDQRIGVMSAFKEEGNDAFKNRDYAKAKSLYADGVATYEQSVKDSIFAPVSSETKDAVVLRARELASQLSSNASACCLMGEGKEGLQSALEYAKKASELRPKWSKAHYRLGQCFAKLEMHADAAQAFWDARSLEREQAVDPESEETARKLRAIDKLFQQQAALGKKAAALAKGNGSRASEVASYDFSSPVEVPADMSGKTYKTLKIEFNKGDAPTEVAGKFIKSHGLDPSLLQRIAHHVHSLLSSDSS